MRAETRGIVSVALQIGTRRVSRQSPATEEILF